MKEAEETYLRALAGFEHPRGYDHESTLSTAQNLGNIYIIRTRWTKLKQSICGHDPGIAALAENGKARGPEHLKTFDAVHSLVVR